MDSFSQSRRQMGEKIEQLLHQHSPTPILKTEITYQPTPWLEGGILWRIRDIGWDQCAVMFMLGHLPSRIMVRLDGCLLYTSPSPRDRTRSRMPSSA